MTRHPDSLRSMPSATLVALVLAACAPDTLAAPPPTFCNPLNLDYGWSATGFRHSADPVIVLFGDRYYLFATDDVPGYRVSDDLLAWTNIVFPPELIPLMSDNDRGTYCAPAVSTDGMDLGRPTRVNAVQVNFAEQDIVTKPVEPCGEPIRYKLFASDDGRRWRALSDEVRAAPGPHDYIAFAEPPPLRFLKIEILSKASQSARLRNQGRPATDRFRTWTTKPPGVTLAPLGMEPTPRPPPRQN